MRSDAKCAFLYISHFFLRTGSQTSASAFTGKMAAHLKEEKTQVLPDFLNLNDLACKTMGGKVNVIQLTMYGFDADCTWYFCSYFQLKI